MNVSRRTFLQASAAFAGASALAASAGAQEAAALQTTSLPILDTHQHLWDLDKFTLPWNKKDAGPLGKNFVTADYLAAVKNVPLKKAIYMEVDVLPAQHVAEAEYVLALTKDPRNLTVAAVIGGRPADENFAKYVERFKDEPKVIGMRQVLHGDSTPAGFCLAKEFVAGVQSLGKHGKTFDLCMRPAELGDAVKLVDACPETRFILDHCGNGSIAAFQKSTRDEKAVEQYRRDIDALAKRDRVVCKISGIVAQLAGQEVTPEVLAPVINTCLDAFGPQRVIFASDWPVCTLGASLEKWIAVLQAIVSERPQEDQRRLFHDNAAKFYGV
jgi:predicted TIM-barrel fold metal-dependent hydrolase